MIVFKTLMGGKKTKKKKNNFFWLKRYKTVSLMARQERDQWVKSISVNFEKKKKRKSYLYKKGRQQQLQTIEIREAPIEERRENTWKHVDCCRCVSIDECWKKEKNDRSEEKVHLLGMGGVGGVTSDVLLEWIYWVIDDWTIPKPISFFFLSPFFNT